MSIQNQDIPSITEVETIKPSSQEVEKALVNIVKAGIYCRRPKDGKFMQNYKRRVTELRQAEDSEAYILVNARRIFPNVDKYQKIMDDYKSYYSNDLRILNAIMDLYRLYYKLAKDYFITEERVEEEADDFLNS